MENKIETLLNKLEFGEVINFNNSYLIINPDELNREKVNNEDKLTKIIDSSKFPL